MYFINKYNHADQVLYYKESKHNILKYNFKSMWFGIDSRE